MSVSSGVNREVNLEIEVPVSTKLRVSIVNGGITVDSVDSEVEINTVDGAITLVNVGGSVVAHAVDGNISATIARVAPQAPMAFTSLNGDIDVTLPAAVKANLRLRSDQGDVFTDFDVQVTASASANRTQQRNGRALRIDVNRSIYGTVNGGAPDFELRTFDGSIYVRKASRPAACDAGRPREQRAYRDRLDLTDIASRHVDVAALQPADHGEVEHVALEGQDDVFPRAVIVFAAEARRNLVVVQAVPYGLQMVVRRSNQ